MLIMIGTDGTELTSKVAKRFGHARYYIKCNENANIIEVIDNPEHDEKHQVLIDAINNGVNVFIVGNIGPHAFSILNREGVKIYLARNISSKEALEKLRNNELELLTEPTVKKSMHKH